MSKPLPGRELPKELREVLSNIVATIFEQKPLPLQDYGTTPFNTWFEVNSSGRYLITVKFLNHEAGQRSEGELAIVMAQQRHVRHTARSGLLVALVPDGETADHPQARYFSIAAANINGVHELEAREA